MLAQHRKQLTLFVHPKDAVQIEEIRANYNPVQYQLIPAHVTLCREDEIEPLAEIITRIQAIALEKPLEIEFTHVERFSDGKGVFMPCVENYEAFTALRKAVLGTAILPKKQVPHITLMHPRNAMCTDALFEQIKKIELPNTLSFSTISLIEQKNGGIWKILQEFDLMKL
jgi:2'-5' RNA ligase